MRFCEDCGTHLRRTKNGLWCPQCDKTTKSKHVMKRKIIPKDPMAIRVIDKTNVDYVKVSQTCPKCGNTEAYRWFSRISGEHAGIRRERTVEHFRCTKCSYLWSKGS